MDVLTARLLCDETKDFYRRFGESFSKTRRSAWPGWSRCLEVVREGLPLVEGVSVLDMACGNLRFEAFLAQELAPATVAAFAVDDCDALARDAAEASATAEAAATAASTFALRYQSLDILETLFAGASLPDAIDAPSCDLSVCFGFMHHVPLPEQRVAVLDALVAKTRPGGFVAVSFWRFLDDEAYAVKARAEHGQATLELGLPPLPDNDCVLGWQGQPRAHRYCHSFTEEELDALVEGLRGRAVEAARFRADGRKGQMNSYVILQVL